MKLLKDAAIAPLEGTMDSFTGGVYSSAGQFIEDSLLDRGKPAQLQETTEYLPDMYIYGGCLFANFGHFIWESLARLYTIRQCKEFPILFISPNDTVFTVQKLFLTAIGIRNAIHIVKAPTHIKNLLYSPPGSSIHPLYITEEQIEALACLHFPHENTDRKIWLSRSRLKLGRLLNEAAIESALEKCGFEIVYPETLPIREQVRLISTSRIVAGCDGSQFFSFLFAKEIQGKFFVCNRRKNIPKTIPYALEKRNIDFSLHVFDLEQRDGEGAEHNFYLPSPERIVDILSEYT